MAPVASTPKMDARIARTQASVMQAATDLLIESGPAALTVDAVVARSGVAKSTVYRHWATRDDLINAVFHHCAPPLDLPRDDEPFEPALRQLARSLVDMLGDPHWKRLLPAIMILKSEMRPMAELENDMKQEQINALASVLRRGIDEGRLRPDVLDDIQLTVVLLVGPFLMAALDDSMVLDEAFADRAVDHFIAASRADTAPSR